MSTQMIFPFWMSFSLENCVYQLQKLWVLCDDKKTQKPTILLLLIVVESLIAKKTCFPDIQTMIQATKPVILNAYKI